MAIQIEQERKPVNWIGILTVLVLVGFLVWLVYFFFFSRPELLIDFIPSQLEEIEDIRSAADRFDPDSFADSPEFRALQDYGFDLSTPPTGRDNPFTP